MASSLPVIVSKISPFENYIQNDYNGYVVNVGDYKAISKILYSLYKNPSKRIHIGKIARESIIHLSMSNSINQFVRSVHKSLKEKSLLK